MSTITTLKEIKEGEHRVALTPAGVKKLVHNGHSVLVQKNAGTEAGFSDKQYKTSGATIGKEPLEMIKKTDILTKIKEPLPQEYELLDNFKEKILFTYLHLSGTHPRLTKKLLHNNISAVGYETVSDKQGRLPLLEPMSEIAGILAIQYGAQYLQKRYGGKGITLGRIHNTNPSQVVVIGGGTVGTKAALTAARLGSKVTLLEIKEDRINELKTRFKKSLPKGLLQNIRCIRSTSESIKKNAQKADLLVGAVLVPGARAPTVVKKGVVKNMKKGSVIIDVAIDQGGCIWGSKPTTHEHPIYNMDEKIFCCITNMPGQVPFQSTQALTSATLPYLLKLANNKTKALKKDKHFAKGLNTHQGRITNKRIAKDLKMMDYYSEPDKILQSNT